MRSAHPNVANTPFKSCSILSNSWANAPTSLCAEVELLYSHSTNRRPKSIRWRTIFTVTASSLIWSLNLVLEKIICLFNRIGCSFISLFSTYAIGRPIPLLAQESSRIFQKVFKVGERIRLQWSNESFSASLRMNLQKGNVTSIFAGEVRREVLYFVQLSFHILMWYIVEMHVLTGEVLHRFV